MITLLFGIGKVLSINENNKTNSNMVGIEKKRIMKYPSSGYGNLKNSYREKPTVKKGTMPQKIQSMPKDTVQWKELRVWE